MRYPRNFRDAVGFRQFAGAYDRVSALGINPDVDQGTIPEDVHPLGGIYPWIPAGGVSLEFLCGASDFGAGTGARSVSISGLDTSFNIVTQTITLTSAVTQIPLPLYRINTARVLLIGSNGTNVADIVIRDTGGGSSRAVIPAGTGIVRQSQYTVPAGYSLQITHQFFGITRTAGQSMRASVTPFVRPDGLAYLLSAEIPITDSAPVFLDASPGPLVTEKSDFGYRCMSVGQDNTSIVTMFNAQLKRNGAT